MFARFLKYFEDSKEEGEYRYSLREAFRDDDFGKFSKVLDDLAQKADENVNLLGVMLDVANRLVNSPCPSHIRRAMRGFQEAASYAHPKKRQRRKALWYVIRHAEKLPEQECVKAYQHVLGQAIPGDGQRRIVARRLLDHLEGAHELSSEVYAKAVEETFYATRHDSEEEMRASILMEKVHPPVPEAKGQGAVRLAEGLVFVP
ncbi:MAG TPA: hypothetical protein DD400_03725 [Rhodospirillaceae bacterium]|nr:hypothetical protein [Rhodospirillaceae bacterium]